MSPVPKEHLVYLRKTDFIVDVNPDIFSKDELNILKKYGNWFLALTGGDVKPFTDSQKRFIKVVNDEEEPSGKYEKAWWKYVKRKEIENRNEKK